MKNRIILLLFLILMTALAAGCTPGNGPESSVVLYGVTSAGDDSHGTNTSWLYEISTTDGTATAIGDTGYEVKAIAYDPYTRKLYATATSVTGTGFAAPAPTSTQIIEIDKETGEGTIISSIYLNLRSLTFNSSGTAVVWSRTGEGTGNLQILDPDTGDTSLLFQFDDAYYQGSLAFNNSDVLYLLNRSSLPYVNTIDMSGGGRTYMGAVSEESTNWYYNGAFHPQTGKLWSLDINPYYDSTQYRNLLVVDFDTMTIENTIPTLDYMQAIAFGYR